MPKKRKQYREAQNPGTRPDRKQKLRDSVFESISVVKCTLNQILTPAGRELQLEKFLVDVNQAVWEAYLFANFHVCRLREAGLPPVRPDQEFYYRCLATVTDSPAKLRIRDAEVRNSAALWRADFHAAGYVPANSEHISAGAFNNASQQMATNATVKPSIATSLFGTSQVQVNPRLLRSTSTLAGTPFHEPLCCCFELMTSGFLTHRPVYGCRTVQPQRSGADSRGICAPSTA